MPIEHRKRTSFLIGLGDDPPTIKFHVDFLYTPICRRCGVILTPETLRHEIGIYSEGEYQAGFVAIFLCQECEKGHAKEELDNTVQELKGPARAN